MNEKIILKAALTLVTLGAYMLEIVKDNIGKNRNIKTIRI